MPASEQSSVVSSRWGLFLVCVMVLLAYSNTFQASWHMDDFPNIVYNHRLQLDTISFDNLMNTFSARPTAQSKELWRPLPCLSFALNYYFGRDEISGYHAVNLMVHLVTAFFLFFTTRLFFQTPTFQTKVSQWEIHATALLTTIFWALNPIQIQAVTYIVQRMAAMAAMFTIIGLYAYLRGRLSGKKNKWGWYTTTVLAFGGAMLSKENAVVFPLSIMLIEWVFFNSEQSRQWILALFSRRRFVVVIIAAMIIAGFILHQVGNPIDWSLYDKRPFTLWQRLISQPRILIFYLSLLFYPAPWRLSIEHEVNHSLTLLNPWTTIPAILAVLGLILAGMLLSRKTPLFSFAILFFFINHIVESTVLPLELVFEHRNYLPSFFIFLPVAFFLPRLMQRYRTDKFSIFILLFACMTFVLTALGLACYERNKVWRSDYNLWYDALQKAPGRARPLMALGAAIGWGKENIVGGYDITIGILERALSQVGARNDYAAQIHQNMALAHMKVGQKEKAFESFEKALNENPNQRRYRFDYIEALMQYGQWDEALHQLETLKPDIRYKVSDWNYKALVNLWMGRPDVAMTIVQQSLSGGGSNAFTFHIAGAAMTELEYFDRGRWFLSRALEKVEKQSRGKMMIYFTLMENRIAVSDEIGAKDAAYRLLAEYGLDEIIVVMKQFNSAHSSPPVNIEMVTRSLSAFLSEIAINIPNQVKMAVQAHDNGNY